MNINSLPDLCLKKIFSKLPLGDVIQAGQVCKLWKLYQEEITNKIQLKALTVLVYPKLQDRSYELPTLPFKRCWFTVPYLNEVINDDGTPMYAPQYNDKQCHLWFSTLEKSTINTLVEAFPNVSTLEIVIYDIPYSTINQLIHLLEKWSNQLVSLKVLGRIKQNDSYTSNEKRRLEHVVIIKKLLQLLQTIDLLPKLDHLTFDTENKIFDESDNDFVINPRESKELKLYPRFSQLKELYINTNDCFRRNTLFSYWLQNLASESHRLERFGIGNYDKRVAILSFGDSEEVARKFAVTPNVFWENIEEFRGIHDKAIIFRSFTSLTSLHYEYFQHTSFKEIMNGLGPLRKLLYLHMNFHGKYGYNEANGSVAFDKRESSPLSRFNTISKYQFAQLSSVKILSLSITVKYHSDFDSCHWGWIFPEVQVIIITHYCSDNSNCDQYEKEESKNISDHDLNKGILELIKTFKQCPKLRKIVHDEYFDHKEWDINEI